MEFESGSNNVEPDAVFSGSERFGWAKFLTLVGVSFVGTVLGSIGATIDVAAAMGYNPEQLLASNNLPYDWVLGEAVVIGGLLGGFGTLALARRLGLFQWDLPNS